MVEAGTFCVNADVEKKAGSGASATSKAEAYTNVYIQEVEGWIMAQCRYDFKTNYASLNAETQELLRLITSNLAAIPVILYDMTGYMTRIHAESMINAMYSIAMEAMETIKDQKTVTYSH